ncbi:MAG: aminoacetone oxidase family FAD-binding enzyme [Wujia sp.]
MYDICIVGGGASGLAAAITAAGKNKNIVILERGKKAGRKLYATGNGKCNLTNRKMCPQLFFHSSSPEYETFLNNIMGSQPDEAVISFMSRLGVSTYTNSEGYVYPASGQASSVVWAMLDALRSLHVEIREQTEVMEIKRIKNGFELMTDHGIIHAARIILSCGSSAYASLGGTDSGYTLAESLGHHIEPVRAALCGLISPDIPPSLAGIRVPAHAVLKSEMDSVEELQTYGDERGELQITDYGLSGIMIFNLSSEAGRLLSQGDRVYIDLDLIENVSRDAFHKLAVGSKHRTCIGMLNGLIHDKLAAYVTESLQIERSKRISELTSKQIDAMYNRLRNMRFSISALKGPENAQVCAGGVLLSEVDSCSCESMIVPGLYITGEMLDIDGICGGYNLTFALLSGIRAGKSII